MRMTARVASLALCYGALVLPGAVIAAPDPDPELEAFDARLPGELVNDPRSLIELVQYGADVKSKVVKYDDIPGGAALQVKLSSAPDQAWKVGASMVLGRPIARGEVVTVGFNARALPDKDGNASGRTIVRIQQNSDPWPGFVDKAVDIGPEWQWHEVSAVANVSMTAGGSSLILTLGERAQSVEIGQVIVVKGANAIAANDTPAMLLPPVLQQAGGRLVNSPDQGPWNFYGTGGSQTRIEDKSVFLGKASRVTVAAADSKPWELATGIPVEGAVAAGDNLLVAMAVRTVSADTADGKGTIGIRFQSTEEPWPGFADNVIHPGPQWQLIQLRTTATIDIPEGKAAFAMMFGGTKQVVDVGPVYILKLN